MAIQLPPRSEALIAEQVASGRYASAEDVIAAGVRLLQAHDRKRQRLPAALAEGEEGEGIPFTPALMRRLREEADELTRRGVLPDPAAWP